MSWLANYLETYYSHIHREAQTMLHCKCTLNSVQLYIHTVSATEAISTVWHSPGDDDCVSRMPPFNCI